MTYYPSDPVFLTQGEPLSLMNVLYRTRVARILADADNQVAAVIQRQPLKVVTSIEQRVIDGYVTTYTLSANQKSILERLRLPYTNALEMGYLTVILATLTPVLTYDQTVAALSPLLWYKLNEAATPAISYGSVASVNGTVANMGAFQAATGLAAIPFSYDYDGTTSIVTITPSVGLRSADFTIASLVNPDTTGEGGNGRLFGLDDAGGAGQPTASLGFSAGIMGLTVRNTAAAAFNTVTTTAIPAGAWAWCFAQYNDTTKLCRMWQSASGILTEFAYSGQPALTGTARQIERGSVGNNGSTTQTFDGKYAQFMIYGSLLTTVQMQAIVTASGV